MVGKTRVPILANTPFFYRLELDGARDEADGAEDEEQSEDQGVEVVMAGTGVDEKVRIEDPDGQDGEELRPEHPFLKGEARHGKFLRVKDI